MPHMNHSISEPRLFHLVFPDHRLYDVRLSNCFFAMDHQRKSLLVILLLCVIRGSLGVRAPFPTSDPSASSTSSLPSSKLPIVQASDRLSSPTFNQGSDDYPLRSSAGNELQTINSSLQVNDQSGLRLPLYLRCTATTICVILLIIGFAGNMLVPYVVLKTKDLRNSTNIFLINLSISDILVLMISTPTVLIELHSQPEVWLLGSFVCKYCCKGSDCRQRVG